MSIECTYVSRYVDGLGECQFFPDNPGACYWLICIVMVWKVHVMGLIRLLSVSGLSASTVPV